MADQKHLDMFKSANSADALFNQAWAKPTMDAPPAEVPEEKLTTEENTEEVPDLSADSDDMSDNSDDNESDDSEISEQDNSELSMTSDDNKSLKSRINDKDSETIYVKGADGRKEKLVVNYADKTAIKQAYLKAAGMRKYQAERDSVLSKFTKLESEYKAEKANMDKLEEIYSQQGAKGLVLTLGGPKAWDDVLTSELEKREQFNKLSAEEKFKIREAETRKELENRINYERSEREKFVKQVNDEKEQIALKKLESEFAPVFDRYRFAGKLGDEKAENFYDEMIWDKAKARLAEYPDEVPLSQAIIDKEFRTVASMFRSHISKQAESKVKQIVDNKKLDATKKAQLAAKKGMKSSSNKKQMLDDLAKGDLGSALAKWMQNK